MSILGNGHENHPRPPVTTSDVGSSAAPADHASGINAEFRLDAAELLVAIAFGLAMIADEIAVESSASVKQRRARTKKQR